MHLKPARANRTWGMNLKGFQNFCSCAQIQVIAASMCFFFCVLNLWKLPRKRVARDVLAEILCSAWEEVDVWKEGITVLAAQAIDIQVFVCRRNVSNAFLWPNGEGGCCLFVRFSWL